MVKKYFLYWTHEAKRDLKLIFDYIANAESRDRALYVINSIAAKAKDIQNIPTKHAHEPYINKENVRFAVKWSFKIVFDIEEDTVRILSIFHSAQSPKKINDIIL